MSKTEFTASDVRDVIQRECERLGSQKAWAQSVNISPAYVNDVLAGRRGISAEMAERIGFSRAIVYRRKR